MKDVLPGDTFKKLRLIYIEFFHQARLVQSSFPIHKLFIRFYRHLPAKHYLHRHKINLEKSNWKDFVEK